MTDDRHQEGVRDMGATGQKSEWRRVRVWVGGDVIAEEVKDDPAWLVRYADSMLSRFPRAKVTNEPLSGAVALP